MAIEFNHPTNPSPAPVPIPAPVPSHTIEIPTLLSRIPLVDRLSSLFTSTFTPLDPTSTGPILSVNIPLYAHPLRPDSLPPTTINTMSSHLRDPCLAVPVGSYLDANSPLWALYHANLQNQCLGNLLTLAATEESITHCLSLIHSIQCQTNENLVLTMFQLGMPELLEDIDRYLRELRGTPICNDTPYSSPSPLSSATERTLRRTELMYEISTRGTLDGEFTNASLRSDHPHYQETCYQYHCLGHLRANCPYYECPHCLQFNPGHSQHHYYCHPPSPSSSSSSLNEPITVQHPTCSLCMVPTNAHSPKGNWHTRTYNSRSCSPNRVSFNDSDSDNDVWGSDGHINITGSPSHRDL